MVKGPFGGPRPFVFDGVAVRVAVSGNPYDLPFRSFKHETEEILLENTPSSRVHNVDVAIGSANMSLVVSFEGSPSVDDLGEVVFAVERASEAVDHPLTVEGDEVFCR